MSGFVRRQLLSLACRVLEHMTDEETAAVFNQKTGELYYDAIRKYAAKTNLLLTEKQQEEE